MFTRIRKEAASMIAAIWIGLILGVSFYAASIKFTAVGVGREELLAVGQVTFQGFTWIEFAAFVLLVWASLSKLSRDVIIAIGSLALLLFVQKFAVLPSLDNAITQTVAGAPTEEPILHFVYGAIDCVKLVVLFVLASMLRNERAAP